MKLLQNQSDLSSLRGLGDIALVPTMGNLHQGHLELVTAAQRLCPQVVVSVFVNRLQFGPSEDFDRYPRTLHQDLDKLAELGVDAVFAPSETELYPQPQDTFIEPPAWAHELCGQFRPGHFRGVLTVVMKLLQLIQPEVAVFGQKDYQQWQLIRHMVAQLAVPVRVVGHATVREHDGLAMSSRNNYLSAAEREQAPQLHQMLLKLSERISRGERSWRSLEQDGHKWLEQQGWRVDYVAIRSPDLRTPARQSDQLVILAAAHLGKTRLIDNLPWQRSS